MHRNKISSIEKAIENLSEIERIQLYRKLTNVLEINNVEELNIPEKRGVERLDDYIKNYKMNFIEKIIFFIISLFKDIDFKTFILKKKLNEIKLNLSLITPEVYKSSTGTITVFFYKKIEAIYEFYKIHRKFIEYGYQIINDSNLKFKFINFILDRSVTAEEKQKITFLSKDSLYDFILKSKDYNKEITNYREDLFRHLRNKYKNKINSIYSIIYAFVEFFNANFIEFFEICSKQKSITNVKIELLKDFLLSFVKRIYSFNVDETLLEKAIYILIDFYKLNVKDKKVKLKEDSFTNLLSSILFFLSNDSLIYMLQLALENPFLNFPVFKLNIDIFDKYLVEWEEKISNLIKELENDIRNRKKYTIIEELKEEGFEFFELSFFNSDFINLLKKYALPVPANFDGFKIFVSFYYNLWRSNLKNQINDIIAFRYYLFSEERLRELSELIEQMDTLDKDIDSIDIETQRLKENIIDLIAKEQIKKDKTQIAIIKSTLYQIEEKINRILKNFFTLINKISVVLSYNNVDLDVKKIKLIFDKFITIYNLIYF